MFLTFSSDGSAPSGGRKNTLNNLHLDEFVSVKRDSPWHDRWSPNMNEKKNLTERDHDDPRRNRDSSTSGGNASTAVQCALP
jgi:hypothetical protein